MIKGKTPEDIRKTFHIKNDFTPSEEEQMLKDNAWRRETFHIKNDFMPSEAILQWLKKK